MKSYNNNNLEKLSRLAVSVVMEQSQFSHISYNGREGKPPTLAEYRSIQANVDELMKSV